MGSEVAGRVDFSDVRYAQCWEDADVLLDGLDVRPGDVCLSIASAGDNTLALLTRRPARVIALDLSPAQLACLELRVAAYRALTHPELLELLGSASSGRRAALYRRCRPLLGAAARAFWDARPSQVATGVGGAGRFERYLTLFRRCVLPLVHRRGRVRELLKGGSAVRRREVYHWHWDTWRWRLLFRLFFSRPVLGRLGRDPGLFRYVRGGVAGRLLERTEHALTEQDPAANPYLHWILTGRHTTALPLPLRPENFEAIRAHLDRIEWRCQSLEDYLASDTGGPIDRYNLSDVFEYMSEANCHRILEAAAARRRPGGRLLYWNLFAPRARPAHLAGRLRPLTDLADELYPRARAFFYGRLVIEEVIG
jgi:S-adenosylmethionine:diacylglycerol 3-amino-3-carboxypropyl transferase